MRRPIFEAHATSLDNQAGLASKHFDVDLPLAGKRQAVALGGSPNAAREDCSRSAVMPVVGLERDV
jgi:hypothetical protein